MDLSEADEKTLNVALNNQAIAGEFSRDIEGLLAEIGEFDPQAFGDLRFDVLLEELNQANGNHSDRESVEDRIPQPPKAIGSLDWVFSI